MRKLTKDFSSLVWFLQSLVLSHDHCRRPVQWYSKFAFAMSKDPVYDNRIEEVAFGSEVEKLDLTPEEHGLTITES